MVLTVDLLQQWFARFNKLYFKTTLPVPPFRLANASTRLGYLKCEYVRKGPFSKPKRNHSIHISTYYDLTERGYQTVLLHEMIHYYISFHQLKDTSPHGVLFRKMMEQINSCGWNITVSTNVSGIATNAGAARKREAKPFLLLVIKTCRGETFISSVSPGSAARIHEDIRRVGSVLVEEKWYVSDDARFASFPKVRSMRGHRVSSDAELADFLSVMKPLDAGELFGEQTAE